MRSLRSDLGIISLTAENEEIVRRELERAGLTFAQIVETPPCVVVSAVHPLAAKKKISLTALVDYPRVIFEQQNGASEYYSEDPLPRAPHAALIEVRDRASLTSMLNMTDAYAIGTGFSAPGMGQGTVAVPLKEDVRMQVGYVQNPRVAQGELVSEFVSALFDAVEADRRRFRDETAPRDPSIG